MDSAEVPVPQGLGAERPRTRLLHALALVFALVVPFLVVWARGESLMAALAGPGLTLAGPVGQVPGASPPYADAVAAYIDEPLAVLRHDLVAAGQSDTWNPHNGLGVPLYGNWQSSIDSPLRAIVHAWPRVAFAHDVTYVLRLVLAGLGAFLLALRLGTRATGALAAGLAFAWTGYFVRYLPMHHLSAEVLLPWLLLTSELVMLRRHPVRALFAHVFVAWCIVVGGNPQPALVAAFATTIFALARLRVHGLAGLRALVLASLPPVLLAAPYVLAGFEYVRESMHHHDASFGADGYTLAGGLGFFLPECFFVPRAAAGQAGGDGLQPLHSLVAPYFGISVFVLAGLGLGMRPLRGAWLLGLTLLFTAKLVNLPIAVWLGEVPGFAQMKIFKYGYPVAALGLALLAANGTHAVESRALAWPRVLLAGLVPLGLLALTLQRAHVAAAELAPHGVRLVWSGATACALLWCGTLLLAARGRVALPRGLACVIVLGVELALAMPRHFLPRTEPFAAPGYARVLQQARAGTARAMPMLGVLMPNQNAVLGVDALTLHDGVFPRRYAMLVRDILNPNVRRWPVFTGEDLGERPDELVLGGLAISNRLLPQGVTQDVKASIRVDLLDATRSKVLDLCNVKWLVLPSFELTRAWVRAWPKEAGKVVHEDADAIVFERETVLPRAFFPRAIRAVDSPEAALAALRDPAFAPRELGLVESPGAGAHPQPAATSAYVETRRHPHELVVSAQADAPGWLVISQSVYPGWRAELDGAAVPLVPANLVGCAVLVPRGKHQVRLVYEPTWRSQGSVLAAFGGLLCLALALWSWRRSSASC